MRETLRALDKRRIEVFAKVGNFGKKAGWKGREVQTVCLVDLTDRAGAPLADHLWITVGKQVKALKLRVGEQLKFVARSRPYMKGPRGEKSVDWCLSNPTKFVKLSGAVPQKQTSQTDLFNSIT